MVKMSKISLVMLALMLSMIVAAGTASANCIGNASGTVFGCGSVVTESCTFNNGMNCATRHGLIVGAAGITIDGNGFTLDGGGAAGRNCTVDSDDTGCPICPCRQAIDGNVIDSGIVNANTTLGNSCNPAAPMGQGGCDNVTVKNLYITGWCDGIFMSGSCSNGDQQCVNAITHCTPVPGQTVGAGVNSEYRLTGLVIEGNCIKDNGDDCGTQNGGDVCDWTTRNFNDGIFLAQVGVNSTTCSTDDLKCSAPCDNPCPHVAGGVWPPEYPEDHSLVNYIAHNKIYNQKGCCCESCPGGNCINLNGGLEERPEYPCEDGCWYSGCNEIAKNICKNTGCSSIQFHFGTDRNRIHGNYCRGYDYCGISTACDWLDENYIYSNNIKGSSHGSGIVVNSPADIWNNFSLNNQQADAQFAHIYTGGAPTQGYGIAYADTGGGGPACLIDNTAVGNEDADIAAILGAVPAGSDKNMCQTTVIHTDASPGPRGLCRYDGGDRLNCKADLNHDCRVWLEDYYIFSDEWTLGADYCCPCPWGE